MNRRWPVLGVPSSAGAHTPGLEKGPAALRAAGLVAALRDVEDRGDVSGFRWCADPARLNGQNASAVAAVARGTAAGGGRDPGGWAGPVRIGWRLQHHDRRGCGFVAAGRQPALVYMDGGPDLCTPDTRANGNLDEP